MNFMKRSREESVGSEATKVVAFSVLELLVAMTILSLLLALVLSMLNMTQATWRQVTATSSQFREAGLAIETMRRRLRQAVLNTYWDYERDAPGEPPVNYRRASELHFISGPTEQIVSQASEQTFPTHGVFFVAPFGFTSQKAKYETFSETMNAWGFFIEYGDDRAELPPFLRDIIAERYSYRLKEFRQPTEDLELFENASTSGNGADSSAAARKWYAQWVRDDQGRYKRTLAENIVALIIMPMEASGGFGRPNISIAPRYLYDSRSGSNDPDDVESTLHLLPPLLRVTVVAFDQETLTRIGLGSDPPEIMNQRWFKRAGKYDDDIKAMEKSFNDDGYGFRVFTTVFPMRAGRWSGSSSESTEPSE